MNKLITVKLFVLTMLFSTIVQAQVDPRDKHIGFYIGTTEYYYGNERTYYPDSLYVYKSNTYANYIEVSNQPRNQADIDTLKTFYLYEFCSDSTSYGQACDNWIGKFYGTDSIINTFYITGHTRGHYRFRGKKEVVNPSVTELKAPVLNLSPNPVNDWLYVDLGNGGNAAPYSLYDVRGQLVESGTLLQNPIYPIELGHLKAGMYFLAVQINDQRLVGKVLKY